MAIDMAVKKVVIELISKEKDISIGSLPNQPNMSTQDHLRKSKELLDDTKKQVENRLRKSNSVLVVVIGY